MEIKQVPLNTVWHMRRDIMYPSFTIDQVKLADDEAGLHLGVYMQDEVVSVVSVFIAEGSLQFRKFATQTAVQGKGYGSFLLKHVLQLAVEQHCATVWCNARTTAIPFYERFGMYPQGNTWFKDGHMFIRMEKLVTRVQTGK